MRILRAYLLIIGVLPAICFAGESFELLQEEANQIKQKYSIESIESSEVANAAIGASLALQSRLGSWYVEHEAACYERFFVNACLQDVKLKRRQLLPELKAIELAAKDFKRHAKAVQGEIGM